jgi:murein tripeptide amidase MpaA
VINFATDLLEAYTAGTGVAYGGALFNRAQIASIVNRLDVIVFPDINPDGRNHSQTVYPMWRKNRNPASSSGDPSRIGVDPNRNYDFLWDFPTKFSPGANPSTLASVDPRADIFHGTAPFSERETQNVRWLFDHFPRIRSFVDVHSYGGDVLYPWGDDEDQTSDPTMTFVNPWWDHQRGVPGDNYREYIPAIFLAAVQARAQAMRNAIAAVRGEPYTTQQAFWIPGWPSYPTSGASDDWAFGRHFAYPSKHQIYGFTIEFNPNQTFFPTWDEMIPIIADIDAGLLALAAYEIPRPWVIMWCRIRGWICEAIWHRVLPPELWGPYGLWTGLTRLMPGVLSRVTDLLRSGRPASRG